MFSIPDLLSNTITSNGLSFMTCNLKSDTCFYFAKTLNEWKVEYLKTQTEEGKLLQLDQESIKACLTQPGLMQPISTHIHIPLKYEDGAIFILDGAFWIPEIF